MNNNEIMNDNEALDNNGKKSFNKNILYILIVLILIIGFGVGGWFLGVHFASNENKNSLKETETKGDVVLEDKDENDKENKTDKDDEDETIKVDYTKYDYAIIHDKDASKKYLSRVLENGSYEALMELDYIDDEYYGRYDNKLYFSYSDEMSYVDLTSDKLTREKWFNVTQPECDHACYIENIYKFIIYKDTIYYNIGSSYSGGIMTLDKDADSDKTRKSIIEDADTDWYFDEKREVIYYKKDEFNGGLYAYDINTKKSTMIEEDVEDFDYNGKDYIMYYNNVGVNSLYLYNLNTKKKTELTNSIHSFSGNLWTVGAFSGDYVYYSEYNGKVYSYNLLTNKKEFIYDVLNGQKPEAYYGVSSSRGDIVYLFDKQKNNIYVKDGKIIEKLPSITFIDLNGNSKSLYITCVEK